MICLNGDAIHNLFQPVLVLLVAMTAARIGQEP